MFEVLFYKRASSFKLVLVWSLLWSWSLSQAQSNWLTLTGEPGNAQVDIVEVEPESRTFSADFSALNVRVSRATLRTSWDGVPYRSYTAGVVIDCAAKTGRYVSISYFMMPLWEGGPHKTSSFTEDLPRPMQFRSVEPNPTERLIRAACVSPRASSVK